MSAEWKWYDFLFVILTSLFLTAAAAAVLPMELGDQEGIITTSWIQYLTWAALALALAQMRTIRRHGMGLVFALKDIWYIPFGFGLQLALSLLALPLIQLLRPNAEPLQEAVSTMGNLQDPLLIVAFASMVTVAAPIVEELTFRGILMGSARRLGIWWSIIISAVVFSLFHIIGLSDRGAALIALPQILILGGILGWMTWKADRLGPAIATHAGFNLLAVVLTLTGLDY